MSVAEAATDDRSGLTLRLVAVRDFAPLAVIVETGTLNVYALGDTVLP